MTIFRFFLLLLAMVAMTADRPLRADASDISAVSRSVVRVAVFSEREGQRQFIGHGSGVAIAPDKVVTNAHVLSESQYDESVTFVVIPSEGSTSYPATVVMTAPGKDLSLLQITGGRLTPATLYAGIVEDGVDVFAIGYPANVDIALEQSEDDTLRPQIPVKTRGSVSSGRTSKNVDSLLHTAPIAPGNSGGPLVDACGRVLGINSFGSLSDGGGGAEFYFAVSIRELAAFLQARDIPFKTTTAECRSVAELTRAEAEREAAARARVEAENRIAAELKSSREGKARRDAEYSVIAERENHIALAGLLLLIAAAAGGAAWQFQERGNRQSMKAAAGVGGICLLAAILMFAFRPSFDEVDSRVREAIAAQTDAAEPPKLAAKTSSGERRCVIQPERSRVTVSDTADVTFTWTPGGCVNGRTQYVEHAGSWLRSFVPNEEAQVSLVSYNPETRNYRIERYLLGLEAMKKAREARQRYEVKSCAADGASREKIDNMNKAIREILPSSPNEVLNFECRGTM